MLVFYNIIDSDISRVSLPFKINSHVSDQAIQAGDAEVEDFVCKSPWNLALSHYTTGI